MRLSPPTPLPSAALAVLLGLLLGDLHLAAWLPAPLLLLDAARPPSRVLARALLLGLLLARAGGADTIRAEALPPEGRVVLLEGRVANAEPPPGGGRRVLLDATSAGEGDDRRRWSARLDLDLDGAGFAEVWPGDRVRVAARVRPVPGPRNPGGADPRRRARVEGVAGWARAEDGASLEVVEPSTGVAAAVAQARASSATALDGALAPQDAGLARALLLGDRGGLSDADRERFRAAGQAHLVAVSGQHVALVLAAVLLLAARLGASARAAALLGLLAVALYVPLTGSPPSAVRSGVGASLWLLGRLLLRQPSGLPMLAAAALVMLAVAPTDLLDPGFTLSFGAVLGIELLGPRFTALLVPDAPVLPGLLPRRPARLRRLLAMALAAWLGSAALALFLLGQVNFVAAPLSVPAVPLTAALLASAALVVLLSPLPALAAAPAWLFARAADLLRALLEAPAALGLATVRTQPPDAGWLALAVVTLLVAGLGPVRLFRWALLAQALLFAVALAPPAAPRPEAPRLVLLDAGRSPAAVLLLPDGRSALLDAGSRGEGDAGRRVVLPALRALGVARLDLALSDSAEPARLLALADVLDEVPARRCLVPATATSLAPGGAQPLPASATLLEGSWGRLEILAASPPLDVARRAADRAPVLRLVSETGRSLVWPTEREEEGVDDWLLYEEGGAPDVVLLPRLGVSEALRARLVGAWAAAARVAPARGSRAAALPGTLEVEDLGAISAELLPEGVALRGLGPPPGYGARATYDRPAVTEPLPHETLLWFGAGLAAFAALTVRPLRWLRAGGAAAAWALGLLVTYVFGWPGFAALFAPFVVATLLGKLPGAARDRGRSFVQVLSNGLPAALGAGLGLLPGVGGLGFSFLLGSLACLGADTCATEIGVRYGGTPCSLLTGRPLERGESGGVTSAGLWASLGGALLAPIAYLLVAGLPDAPVWALWGLVGLYAAAGVGAALLDSVLGATLQYRGRDPATGRTTESRRVAGVATERVSGWRWLDNDAVNLVTGLVGGLFALALAWFWLA